MEHFMKYIVSLLALATVLGCGQSTANVLDAKSYHLRSGGVAEWEEFEGKTPHGSRLDVKFQAMRNRSDATLLIRQYNVKQEWPVLINDQKIGILFLMEDPLSWTLRVPSGVLKDGENTLSIIPPKENDDIVISQIELLYSVPAKAFTGKIEVLVHEENKVVPCRITITDNQNALAALRVDDKEKAAARPGVVYSADGLTTIELRPGVYTVFASRGPEYSVATQTVAVAEGKTLSVEMALVREVPTPGLVSCDTHIHTFTHAKHGDATIHERMLTIAGEGLELPISTEHNMLADFSGPAKAAGV